MRPGTNSLAFFTYVNKALLQFILQKLLSSNVDIFWSLLLFESAVRSLGVLPRVFSILELLNIYCVFEKATIYLYLSRNNQLIILGSSFIYTQHGEPVRELSVSSALLR